MSVMTQRELHLPSRTKLRRLVGFKYMTFNGSRDEPETTARQAQSKPRATPETTAVDEPVLQFSMSLRKSLRKQLARISDDAEMTMRSFILNALKEKGLKVTEADLMDLRKERA